MALDKNVEKRISKLVVENPDSMAAQMVRIVAMARIGLPTLTSKEIDQIVSALGGVNLPPLQTVPLESTPALLARRLPESDLKSFILDLEPFEAFLLLICAELAGLDRLQADSSLGHEAFFPLKGRDDA